MARADESYMVNIRDPRNEKVYAVHTDKDVLNKLKSGN